jgi:DNA-binding NtrC family response regulator
VGEREAATMTEEKARVRGLILVVDDEKGTREGLSEILREDGYEVSVAADGVEALEKVLAEAPDVVISDLKMPKLDGMGLLQKAIEIDADVKFILMTAFGSIKTAVEAMRHGAEDYLVKPVDIEEMELCVERTLERRKLVRDARGMRERLDARYRFDKIIGNSPQMQQVFKTVVQIAPSRSNILIHPPAQSTKGQPLRGPQLREPDRDAPGERALRP